MISELTKRWRQRLTVWLIFLSIMVLIDEYIKEGYFFNWLDLFTYAVTHEKIFIALLIALIIVVGRR